MTDRGQYREAAEFRRALSQFLAESDADARAAGLTPQRYLMLLAIAASEHGRLTISELVEPAPLRPSTITELVDRAEAAGLVARGEAAGDGRVVVVTATPLGERRFRKAFSAIRDDRERLLRHLGPTD